MNSKCIRFKTFIVCFVCVIGLTACGGGGDGVNSGSQVRVQPPPSGSNVKPNTRYGAVYSALHNGSRFAVIRNTPYETSAEAHSRAISYCNDRYKDRVGFSDCRVEFTYTNCAAVASPPDESVFGLATGDNLSSAQSSATTQCNRRGGRNCSADEFFDVDKSCIAPITQQSPKYGGFRNSILTPSLTYSISNTCFDNMDYSLFGLSTREGPTVARYPDSGHNSTDIIGEATITVYCTDWSTGRQLNRFCLGARVRGNSWGFGIGTDGRCSNCCNICPTSGNRPVSIRVPC